VSRIARAQAYPSKPVIVGVAAGGPTDIIARLIGQWLSERLGHQFVIENRSGVAGGTIAAEAVVRAPPDGRTLLMVGPQNATSATFYDNLSFNFIRDFAPVAGMIRTPWVMVANLSVPAKTVPDIAYANSMASAGTGGGPHGQAAASKCSLIRSTCQSYLTPIQSVKITVQRCSSKQPYRAGRLLHRHPKKNGSAGA
jgi:tripartite-type tricarboxylate transporter receptor subunit TctC